MYIKRYVARYAILLIFILYPLAKNADANTADKKEESNTNEVIYYDCKVTGNNNKFNSINCPEDSKNNPSNTKSNESSKSEYYDCSVHGDNNTFRDINCTKNKNN